jgi:hypothetical protein
MQREIKVGSISWINEKPSPIWFSGKAALLDPDWVPKTYMGLVATSNHPPPAALASFPDYRKAKDFRALLYCHLRLTIDDQSRRITRVEVLDAVHDPGWTPAFRVRDYPLAGLRFWDTDIWSFTAHAGEASPISVVRTEARHPNSAITTVPANETVLVDGIIKFRAGANTDRVGIESVGCPYHVPWVWCETVLTYDGSRFKLYGVGSIFPTHCWYVDGTQVASKAQVGDSSFPSASLVVPSPSMPVPGPRLEIPQPLTINVTALNLYPVLSKGAPASSPQTPLSADAGRGGAVDTHPNTVAAGALVNWP